MFVNMAARSSCRKWVLVALVACCALQRAFAAPHPVENQSSAVALVPPQLELIGKTALQLVDLFGQFMQRVVTTIQQRVVKGYIRFSLSMYVKTHAVLTAGGLDDADLQLTDDELREYRVVAKTAMRLRQMLRTMERLQVVFDSASDIFENDKMFWTVAGRRSLEFVVKDFYGTLDKRLKEHPELGSIYAHVRDSVAEEHKNVDLNLVRFSSSELLTKLAKDDAFSTPIKLKLTAIFINKQFLNHAFRQLLVVRDEYYILTRSTLELAKKSNNLEKVQQIYDESLAQAALAVDVNYGTVWDMRKALFAKLRENFEKSPALNHELRIIQKNIAEKHDWDRKSIWEVDILPW